jgi:hypothetical protein
MNNPNSVIALIVVLALGGCAGSPIANESKARQSYEQSVADYRACLGANETNVRAVMGNE